MARYKMTVVFDVHEEVEMKFAYQNADKDIDNMESPYVALKGVDISDGKKTRPHINKLYEDIIERIAASLRHPITYDIVSFEELKVG
jgi:hypothetical protein